jgi:inner membrane protein YidH
MPAMDEPGTEDATRRTFLAQERTLLAWWRSGLAALAVAVAVGRLVPSLLRVAAPPFVTLGVCFGVLGIAFFVIGSNRNRTVQRRLQEGGFTPLDDRLVWWLTRALVVLSIATMILLIAEP